MRSWAGTWQRSAIAEARSALAWWLEAGVDVAIQEEPRNWLKPAPTSKPRATAIEPAPPPNVTQPGHETLAELQQWLASSAHLPLASATARRIMPHGPENAAIMLLERSADAGGFRGWAADRRRIVGARQENARGDQDPGGPGVQRLAVLLPRSRRADEPGRPRGLRRNRAAAYRASPSPSACSCSATDQPRRCSANRCPRRAVMCTRSKACAPSPPSIRAS